MRTKTKILSALLGVLGTASLMAQSTNVYSLNAVGYINMTFLPGFNIIACPLISTPDNTIGTLLNNTNGAYDGVEIFTLTSSGYTSDVGHHKLNATNGWANGGTITANPGQAIWFENNSNVNLTATFVGTVPQGSLTNTLIPGYNMVSSAVPTSGDLVTNSITSFTNYNAGDEVQVFNATNQSYTVYLARKPGVGIGYNGTWSSPNGDPIVPNVGQGFFYQNNQTTNLVWMENFSVNP